MTRGQEPPGEMAELPRGADHRGLLLCRRVVWDCLPGTSMCSGTEAGSYFRLIDSCITQLKAQGPSRTCNESKEEEEADHRGLLLCRPVVVWHRLSG